MNTTVNPYLTFNGNCEEAFNFYKSVFGGDFDYVGRFKDMPMEKPIPEEIAEKILHISLKISEETALMGSDASPEFGPPINFGNNITLSLSPNSEEEARRLFNELSVGGEIIIPLDKTFWGALFTTFTDKFGITWMINYIYEQEQ